MEPRLLKASRLALLSLSLAIAGCSENAASEKMPGTQILAEAIEIEALPMIVGENIEGLGGDATELRRWVNGRARPLRLDPVKSVISDARGATLTVSPAFAIALNRLIQWYGLAAPSENEITHAQLESAALSPASVARIQTLFDDAITRGVRVSSSWLTPEIGGEATIDEELRLVESVDRRWSAVASLATVSKDPKAVAEIYGRSRTEIAALDTHSLLRLALERLKLKAPGAAAEVARAVETLVLNNASTYTHEPEEQLALILRSDWRGRYVGRWHTHPPHDSGAGWTEGGEPSFEDMQNALDAGQYLTLVFQPDGFDLYDAEPLADARRIDLKLMKVIRYRSASWRDHFEKRHADLTDRR